jgi:acetoin utilization deacetylase AcuC-like enzyme
VLVCLEGGYQPDALGASVVATLRALGAQDPPRSAPAAAAEAHLARVRERWTGI